MTAEASTPGSVDATVKPKIAQWTTTIPDAGIKAPE